MFVRKCSPSQASKYIICANARVYPFRAIKSNCRSKAIQYYTIQNNKSLPLEVGVSISSYRLNVN